jgi:hypothetical protein
VQLQHRLVRVGVDEVLRRDPWCELLFDIKLAVVVVFGVPLVVIVGVTGILEGSETDLHRFGETDGFGLGELEHVVFVRDGDGGLDHPETLVVSLANELHELLLVSKKKGQLHSMQGGDEGDEP